jgi:hypothetical protein
MAHQAAADLDPVVRPRDLPGYVVEGLDPDVIGVQGEDPGGLAGRHPAQLGTITSTTKQPPGSNWTAALANTASWAFWVVTLMIVFATR